MTKAEREARKAWLASLKVGDEIAVTSDDLSERLPYVKIYRVTGINEHRGISWWTNAHRSAAPCAVPVNNGRIRTPYGSAYIRPVTDEIRRIVAVRDARERLRRAFDGYGSQTDGLTDDQVLRMIAIVDEVTP